MKSKSENKEIEKFMTGDDPLLDRELITYDCYGTMCHAKMLEKIGIISSEERGQIINELDKIIKSKDKFVIKPEDENVHIAVESVLISKLGDVGRKIRTGRSRNDQILLDLRLFIKNEIIEIINETLAACKILCKFAEANHAVPIPGRTHFQRAMPSSIGLWAGSFAESLLDDVELLKGSYELINQCPLGSAASYGVPLPVDRQYCSDLLGFKSVQNNVLYANNSRGKFEGAVLHALVQIMNDLSKIATDMIIFVAPEFGYLELPKKFCPGSSLMPHKRNPCPLELIRAKSATVQGLLFQNFEIIRALPSGYNRDFQETKRPIMQGLEIVKTSLKIFSLIMSELQVNKETCIKSFTPELFATDEVLKLVSEGLPFGEAYQNVAKDPYEVSQTDPVENILSKLHLGATGNLGIHLSEKKIKENQAWCKNENQKWSEIVKKLIVS